MKFGLLKNMFLSSESKMNLLLKLKEGKVDINNIKYLTLSGNSYSDLSYEKYIFINSYLRYLDVVDINTYKLNDNINIKVEYLGIWRSGTVKKNKIVIKNGEIKAYKRIKPC